MTLHDAGLLFMLGMFAVLYGLIVCLVWRLTGNLLRKAQEK